MLLRRCVSNAVVFLTTRTYRKQSKFNPGLSKRLQIIKEEQLVTEKIQLNEQSLEDLEEDITNMEELSSFHEREVNNLVNKISYKQIERKYFTKEKLPNMLLWAEKEQIKHLAEDDPDVWTPQKLSECFPATPKIIAKLLKSHWKPTERRIKSHDEAVNSNWRAFELGKLNFPEYFAKHLKSFTSRKRIISKKDEKLLELKSQASYGEFSSIVKDYYDTNDCKTNTESKVYFPKLSSLDEDTFVSRKKSRNPSMSKEYTHDALKKVILDGDLKVKNFTELIKNNVTNEGSSLNSSSVVTFNENRLNESANQEGNIIELEENNFGSTTKSQDILMEISIPKTKRKKGFLYKVNNCYYSDDGEFLYRV